MDLGSNHFGSNLCFFEIFIKNLIHKMIIVYNYQILKRRKIFFCNFKFFYVYFVYDLALYYMNCGSVYIISTQLLNKLMRHLFCPNNHMKISIEIINWNWFISNKKVHNGTSISRIRVWFSLGRGLGLENSIFLKKFSLKPKYYVLEPIKNNIWANNTLTIS